MEKEKKTKTDRDVVKRDEVEVNEQHRAIRTCNGAYAGPVSCLKLHT